VKPTAAHPNRGGPPRPHLHDDCEPRGPEGAGSQRFTITSGHPAQGQQAAESAVSRHAIIMRFLVIVAGTGEGDGLMELRYRLDGERGMGRVFASRSRLGALATRALSSPRVQTSTSGARPELAVMAAATPSTTRTFSGPTVMATPPSPRSNASNLNPRSLSPRGQAATAMPTGP
jgi:hypothetical protein